MRQQILRIVCESCGIVEQYEIVNHEPLIATINVQVILDAHGWITLPKHGSNFATADYCVRCDETGKVPGRK